MNGPGVAVRPRTRWRGTGDVGDRLVTQEDGSRVRLVAGCEKWAHLPEPLLVILRTLRAKATARVKAKREEIRREWRARWWREATTFPVPDEGRVRASKREQKEDAR